MRIFARTVLPVFLAAWLAACNSSQPLPPPTLPATPPVSPPTLPASPTPLLVSAPATPLPERIVYYYFATTAENPPPEGSVVIAPDVYILAPTATDLTYSSDTAADLRAALEAVLQDGRNGWVSSDVEIVAANFNAGHADVVLQGEYFGVGDVTLLAASRQILLTVFANAAVQSAAVTLNGDTIGNLGISMSAEAKPAGYVFTRAEIETFLHEQAYASP